jgi:hypothetical protein
MGFPGICGAAMNFTLGRYSRLQNMGARRSRTDADANNLNSRLGLIGGLAPQIKKKIKFNPFEALLI